MAVKKKVEKKPKKLTTEEAVKLAYQALAVDGSDPASVYEEIIGYCEVKLAELENEDSDDEEEDEEEEDEGDAGDGE